MSIALTKDRAGRVTEQQNPLARLMVASRRKVYSLGTTLTSLAFSKPRPAANSGRGGDECLCKPSVTRTSFSTGRARDHRLVRFTAE